MASHHGAEVVIFINILPVYTHAKSLFQDEIEPNTSATTVTLHEWMSDIHLSIFRNNLLKRFLRHRFDLRQNFCQIQTVRKTQSLGRYLSWRKSGDSNPGDPVKSLHTFQACQFNHSCTLPYLRSILHHLTRNFPGVPVSLRYTPLLRLLIASRVNSQTISFGYANHSCTLPCLSFTLS